MNGFRDMEVYDMEQALRLFCDTTTRSFLYEVWSAFKRIEVLKDQVAEQQQTINELMEEEGALDALATVQASRIDKRDDRISELNNRVQALERTSEDRLMYIKELEEREGALEDRIHELETAYDEVDREYKATLEALGFEQGLVREQAETIADRDEDVRKLKIRIVQLEEDKERLQRRRDANSPHRGVGQ